MSDRSPAAHSYLTFRLSGVRFGVDLTAVREVAPYCLLSRPPSRPPFVEGLLNLRGSAVPVLRLELLLALPESRPGLSSLLVVLRDAEQSVALLADEVSSIREVSLAEQLPAPEGATFNGCVEATAADGDETLHLLSPERLLVLREREALAHFRALEQTRLADVSPDRLEAR